MSWQIVPLAAAHDRSCFYSGYPQLDDYIQKYAGQHARKHLGRTFVAVTPGTKQVLGYYTLSASSVGFENTPETLRKKLPRYPLPTALVGKIAVDQPAQGQGLGEFLMMDALRRTVEVSDQMAIFAVEVAAIDERAKDFYLRYGFQAFTDQPLHLFLPLATIKQLF